MTKRRLALFVLFINYNELSIIFLRGCIER